MDYRALVAALRERDELLVAHEELEESVSRTARGASGVTRQRNPGVSIRIEDTIHAGGAPSPSLVAALADSPGFRALHDTGAHLTEHAAAPVRGGAPRGRALAAGAPTGFPLPPSSAPFPSSPPTTQLLDTPASHGRAQSRLFVADEMAPPLEDSLDLLAITGQGSNSKGTRFNECVVSQLPEAAQPRRLSASACDSAARLERPYPERALECGVTPHVTPSPGAKGVPSPTAKGVPSPSGSSSPGLSPNMAAARGEGELSSHLAVLRALLNADPARSGRVSQPVLLMLCRLHGVEQSHETLRLLMREAETDNGQVAMLRCVRGWPAISRAFDRAMPCVCFWLRVER